MDAVKIIRNANWRFDMGDVTIEQYEKLLAPLRDVETVRHGYWIGGAEEARCSVCGRNLLDYVSYTEYCDIYEYPKFCPNCGAKMYGKDGDND